MVKHYVISILASVILCAALVLVMFLVMLPQVDALSSEVVPTYTNVKSDEFGFVETKHVVTELLAKSYKIDTNDIAGYEQNKQYVPGNYDPFTPSEQVNSAVNNSNQNTANNNNTNNNSSNNGGTVISGTTK